MITAALILLSLALVMAVGLAHGNRLRRQRRELQRLLILQAAEQRMQAIDRAALNAMFDVVRNRRSS